MRVAMIGSGYVGLVSGACFAEFGHEVACVDTDSAKISQLKAGMIPIYEPGLEALVERNVRAGRLAFTASVCDAVAAADVVFIAVGTPSRRGDGYADLSYVYAAARDIASALNGFTVVVTKSMYLSAPATRWSGSLANFVPTPNSPSSPIRNSSAKGRRSMTSSGRTGL